MALKMNLRRIDQKFGFGPVMIEVPVRHQVEVSSSSKGMGDM